VLCHRSILIGGVSERKGGKLNAKWTTRVKGKRKSDGRRQAPRPRRSRWENTAFPALPQRKKKRVSIGKKGGRLYSPTRCSGGRRGGKGKVKTAPQPLLASTALKKGTFREGKKRESCTNSHSFCRPKEGGKKKHHNEEVRGKERRVGRIVVQKS